MEEDIRFSLTNDIDFMVWGVYHSAKEIELLQKAIEKQKKLLGKDCKNPNIKIIAKIENETALDDIDNIIPVSNSIFVPRG